MLECDQADDESHERRGSHRAKQGDQIRQLQPQDVLGRRSRLADSEDERHVGAQRDIAVVSEIEIARPAPDEVQPESHDPEDRSLGANEEEVLYHSNLALPALEKRPLGRPRTMLSGIAKASAI